MTDESDFADHLELFLGAASEAVCRVYARLDDARQDARRQLAGTLTGPRCAYAQTLPATFSFVDRGPGRSLLAEAVVPEPCFWTPEMPQLYNATVQWCEGDRVLAQAERYFGIRPLGTAGRKLIFGGKSWVLRGVERGAVLGADLSDWHDTQTAMLVHNPDDALCEAASRVGVLIVAELAPADVGEMRRLGRWPAVGVIALPSGVSPEPADTGHNAILAQRFAVGEPIALACWATAALCELNASAPTLPGGFADCPLPLIAIRPAGEHSAVAQGRAACDRLQRDLAVHGQLAGYIV